MVDAESYVSVLDFVLRFVASWMRCGRGEHVFFLDSAGTALMVTCGIAVEVLLQGTGYKCLHAESVCGSTAGVCRGSYFAMNGMAGDVVG